MAKTITPDNATPVVAPHLLDEVRESATAGQQATGEALRRFRDALNEAVPDAVEPLRKKIVDAAIELADQLVDAQYRFNRSIVHAADRALNKSEDDQK